jgi:hypothetical protein
MAAKQAGKNKTETTREPVPARKAAEVVLLEEGKPLHYQEIARLAMERKIVKVKKGTTVDQTAKTVRSYLAGCAAENVRFVRVAPGVFDLKNRPKKKGTPAKRKAASKG